jgi:NAD(P)-dependent dehydrogenase (short-subunit alcohol dehydrogenase family)
MQMMGRAAVLTGAKRLGADVAMALASRGTDIALGYRSSREEAEATAAAVRALGRRAFVCATDVTRQDDCRRLVDSAAEAFGRLDILINMASLYREIPFAELTGPELDAALAVDLRGAWWCSLAAVPHMRRLGGGRIVNFSDWVARSGRPRYPGYLPYYVAKHAVIGLTEALALELASEGILVNAVAPGPILAPPDLTASESEAVEKATPLGRWGGTGEIVKAVLALLESDFVTGETLRVDGGRHLR